MDRIRPTLTLVPVLAALSLAAAECQAAPCVEQDLRCRVNEYGYEICRIEEGTNSTVWQQPFLPDGSVLLGNPRLGYQLTRLTDGCTAPMSWDAGEKVYASLEGNHLYGSRGGDLLRIDPATGETRRLASLGEDHQFGPPGERDCLLAVSRDGRVAAVTPGENSAEVVYLKNDLLGSSRPHRLLCGGPGWGYVNLEREGSFRQQAGDGRRRGETPPGVRRRGGTREEGSRRERPAGGGGSQGGASGGEAFLLKWDASGNATVHECPRYAHPFLHDGKVYGFAGEGPGGSKDLRVTDCQGYEKALMTVTQNQGAHLSIGVHGGRPVAILSLERTIERMDLETGEREVLARHSSSHDLRAGGQAQARISRDGRYVGFNSDEEGGRGFYVIQLDKKPRADDGARPGEDSASP